MAGHASNFLEALVIDTLIRGATRSLALFTVNPNFATGSGGTEATGGSYSRKTIAFTAAAGGNPETTANTALIEWTLGTDIAAGTYTGWGVYDNASGGNLYFGDAFSSNRIIAITGDKISFAIGAVTFSAT